MNIGSVKPVQGGYIGAIATLTMDFAVALQPVESQNPRAPRFEVKARNAAKRWVRVGALWEAASKNDGVVFLQGSIDDPSLPGRVYIAAFFQDDGSISLVWSRPERQDELKGASAPAKQDADPFTTEPSTPAAPTELSAPTSAKPKGRGGAKTPALVDDLDDEVPF